MPATCDHHLRQSQRVRTDRARRDGVVLHPTLGQQATQRDQSPQPAVHADVGVAGQHQARLGQRRQPVDRAQRQPQRAHDREPGQRAQTGAVLHDQQEHAPDQQHRADQQQADVVGEHQTGQRQTAAQRGRQLAAALAARDTQHGQQQQWEPDEGQQLAQRAARPRVGQVVGRPEVGHGCHAAAPRTDQIACKPVHRRHRQQQPGGHGQLQRRHEAGRDQVEQQAKPVVERAVEVENGEAVAEPLVGQPAGARMPRPQRQVEIEQTKQVVHPVVGVLQTRLPQRLQGREAEGQRQQQRQQMEETFASA